MNRQYSAAEFSISLSLDRSDSYMNMGRHYEAWQVLCTYVAKTMKFGSYEQWLASQVQNSSEAHVLDCTAYMSNSIVSPQGSSQKKRMERSRGLPSICRHRVSPPPALNLWMALTVTCNTESIRSHQVWWPDGPLDRDDKLSDEGDRVAQICYEAALTVNPAWEGALPTAGTWTTQG